MNVKPFGSVKNEVMRHPLLTKITVQIVLLNDVVLKQVSVLVTITVTKSYNAQHLN